MSEEIKGKLNADQEINVLKSVVDFYTKFDRVPGSYAEQWGNALRGLVAATNSLIIKYEEDKKKAPPVIVPKAKSPKTPQPEAEDTE